MVLRSRECGCSRVEGKTPSLTTLNRYAHVVFDERIGEILDLARERVEGGTLPSAYILAVTQEIGQDRANDVSDIAIVRVVANGEVTVIPLVENLRIFHEHAVALAAAFAMREAIDTVRWNKNRRHCWA